MTTEKNQQITLADFIREQNITMTAKRTTINRNMEGSQQMDNWLCTLRIRENRLHGQSMRVPFSMGTGHHGRTPEAADVLNCLASDSHHADSSFEDWADELGYDVDSRKAFRTFRVVSRQAAKLRAFLGAEAFEQLLYGVESL